MTMSTPQAGVMQADLAVGKLAATRPALHERVDSVNQRLEGLDAVLAHLFDRLEPVLRPSAPTPPSDAQAPALRDRGDDDSWLAEYLTKTQDRLDSIANRMRYLADRIDL